MRNLAQWSSDDRYEWISAYIDDELVPQDRQRVEQWLATDPDCQACYQRLMQMRRAFQGLRDQELATLAPIPIKQILDTSSPFGDLFGAPLTSASSRPGLWQKRSLLALASVGGLGLAVLWAVGLRSPWAEPVAHVQPSPEISVASVPSPLIPPPNPSLQISTSLPAPATVAPPQAASQSSPQASTLLVSTEGRREENSEQSGLTFALDQPLLAFPADN
jgi:anti-sigma factor RsiW